ncbi:CDP-alcohol phosphatidyltransferase family protein [Glycomyces sp. A-F 0318]|uniref:CDP-alcohol phosphatidyltransferase family protein n=1 Tax=Glycomyces amatae TaxID=2881355 RepID=UPI001E3ABC3E|nr:CDP-alcohol phosphatidyltransferase family protein [Glycomyces amatae]
MSGSQWRTVPNLVTALRFALVVPIAVLLLTGTHPLLAAGLAVVFGASDWVDGYLARRLGQAGRVGAVLDAVADRVGVGCLAIALGAAGAVPWWAIAVFPAVDLAVGGVYLARRRPLAVTALGKVRTGAAMAGVFLVFAGLVPGLGGLLPVGQVVLGIGAVLHIGAGALYMRRLLR